MKVSYSVDSSNVITWWGFPLKEGFPVLEVEIPEVQIHVGFSQVVDGVLLENNEAYEADRLVRQKVAEEHFKAMFPKN